MELGLFGGRSDMVAALVETVAKIRESGHPNLKAVAAVVLETKGNVAVISSSVPTEPAEPDESLMGPVARQ